MTSSPERADKTLVLHFSLPIAFGFAMMHYYVMPRAEEERMKVVEATERRKREGRRTN